MCLLVFFTGFCLCGSLPNITYIRWSHQYRILLLSKTNTYQYTLIIDTFAPHFNCLCHANVFIGSQALWIRWILYRWIPPYRFVCFFADLWEKGSFPEPQHLVACWNFGLVAITPLAMDISEKLAAKWSIESTFNKAYLSEPVIA